MTGGILGATYVVDKSLGKKYAPSLSTNNLITLGVVTILSRFAIDFLKRKRTIPMEW